MTTQRKKMLLVLGLLLLAFLGAGYFFMVHESRKTAEAAKNPEFMQDEFEAGFEKMQREAGSGN